MRPPCLVMSVLLGCGDPGSVPAAGPSDCAALAHAARRAAACDPAMTSLADELTRAGEEAACRHAIRVLLDPPDPISNITSLHERAPSRGDEPLSLEELQRLTELPLPATLTLVPDLPPRPGVPATVAVVDGENITGDAKGRHRVTLRPGAHTVEIRHAGETTLNCVEIDACEGLTMTVHGARLATHPRSRTGGC